MSDRIELCVRCASYRHRRQLVRVHDEFGDGWQHRSSRACDRMRRNITEIGPGLLMERTQTSDGELFGWIFWHRRRDSPTGMCGGAVPVVSRDGRASWTLVNLDPLTLSPSILCRTQYEGRECGVHGFVTDGKWVAA